MSCHVMPLRLPIHAHPDPLALVCLARGAPVSSPFSGIMKPYSTIISLLALLPIFLRVSLLSHHPSPLRAERPCASYPRLTIPSAFRPYRASAFSFVYPLRVFSGRTYAIVVVYTPLSLTCWDCCCCSRNLFGSNSLAIPAHLLIVRARWSRRLRVHSVRRTHRVLTSIRSFDGVHRL
ncbi:hypothetical protein BD414DRAFT_473569 [Trametes punicea]|nr:hypothetical protein BD414DRAFT_473569 [Trametes punicea]